MKFLYVFTLFFALVSPLFSAEGYRHQIVLGDDEYNLMKDVDGAFLQLPKGFYFPRFYSFPLMHAGGKQYIPQNVARIDFEIMKISRPSTVGFYLDEYGFDAIKEKITYLLDHGFSGEGFVEISPKLIDYFKRNRIAYKEPEKTLVEGANIYFVTIDQKPKAIIGDHSLLLTYFLMGLDNKWPRLEIEALMRSMAANEPVHSYMQRNIELLLPFVCQNITLEELMALAIKPLSREEGAKLHLSAQLVSARLLWCKQQIAKEIELPLCDIVFLPQRRGHIDLDLLVTAKGSIALRAPSKDHEKELWALQKKVLLDAHVVLEDVPALFSSPSLFCGLVIEEKNSYIFPEVDLEQQLAFSEFLKSTCGFTTAVAIGGKEIFEEKEIGLHCLSQDYYVMPKACAVCGKRENLVRCSRCKSIAYCGTNCQRQHWAIHKLDCKACNS